MVTMAALHALTAELHGGFLTLAFAGILIVALAQITVRLKDHMPKRLVKAAIQVRGYTEATGYVAAIAGLIGLVLSSYTGMYAWPQDVLINDPIIQNKILLTAFSTAFWIGVVIIRTRFGRGLWTCPAMATLYTVLAIAGFGVVGLTGSLGAHISQGGSILDPFWDFLHIDVTKTMSLAPMVAALVAMVSVMAFIISLAIARRYDLFGVKLGAETCGKYFKWDEPRIQ
jgi:hypothetical protein